MAGRLEDIQLAAQFHQAAGIHNRDPIGHLQATGRDARGRGRFESLDDIRRVSVGVGTGGTPVTVGDVATVQSAFGSKMQSAVFMASTS